MVDRRHKEEYNHDEAVIITSLLLCIYDHNGIRTGKIVSENGKVEITEYTLHGKLITHMTKRTVDDNGDETFQELHFFYSDFISKYE